MKRFSTFIFAIICSVVYPVWTIAQTDTSTGSSARSPSEDGAKTGTAGDFGGGVSGYSGTGASGTSVAPGTQAPDSSVNVRGPATGFGGTNSPGTATTDPSASGKPVAPQVSGPNRKP